MDKLIRTDPALGETSLQRMIMDSISQGLFKIHQSDEHYGRKPASLRQHLCELDYMTGIIDDEQFHMAFENNQW